MTRKILTFILTCMLVTMPVQAEVYYEEVDISSMNVDQLITLRDRINIEIAEQGGDNVIGKGTYEVGVDIKTGYYEIICSKGAQYGFINVELYQTRDDYNSKNNREVSQIYYNKENPEDSEKATVNLKEGNILILSGEGIVQIIDPSWKP